MALDLETYIGREKEADGYDIRKVKAALNRLGYYTPDETAGITQEAEPAFFTALKAFQRQNGIEPDGRIGPGSLSERALNDAVKTHNVNSLFAGWYIWRTVGDEKVRGNHAQREARIFSWDNPPDGGHPGEDYNCRCWAEAYYPASAEHRSRAMELRQKAAARQKIAEQGFHGLNNEGLNDLPIALDAINPTISPLDLIGPGGIATKGTAATLMRQLTARSRDVSWIEKAARKKLQHAFKHAKAFGIKGNPSNKTLEQFRKELINHVRSPDTRVIKGTYHKQPVTHYYNNKTKLNVMRDQNGKLSSGWKLRPKQRFHIEKDGNIGGSKK